MKITNLKDKMDANIFATQTEYTIDKIRDGSGTELAYIRGYYDGSLWSGRYFVVCLDVCKKNLNDEFHAVWEAFPRSFKDLSSMIKWCRGNARTTEGGWRSYYLGKYGLYEFDMRPDRGDYNLYLHCYSLEAMKNA